MSQFIQASHINVGSGQRPFSKPFVNVDIQKRWNPDVLCDATNMPMFADSSAEVVVLHHVLEHFGCGEADGVLRECRRVLAVNGSLLVFVPDMLELSRMWYEGRLTDQLYMTNIYGAFMGEEEDRHRWGYTTVTLSSTLLAANFSVIHFNWRHIEGADIAKDRWILGLEAIK